VGGLVQRKGFHRVIEVLPELRRTHPGARLVIVGGPSVEGDVSAALRRQVVELGLGEIVRFEGARPPEDLPAYYSAADVFVLATSNEGWANVLLESMACGTPVVVTDVGGNREVVETPDLGMVVPFGAPVALRQALEGALGASWDREKIAEHAKGRTLEKVATQVLDVFREICPQPVG
jgi:glycosyltransferase involved in cell wall biosynthesis